MDGGSQRSPDLWDTLLPAQRLSLLRTLRDMALRRIRRATETGVEHNSVIIVSLLVENYATVRSAAFAKSIADSNVTRHSEGAFSSAGSDH